MPSLHEHLSSLPGISFQKVAHFLFFAPYYSLLPVGLVLPFSSWVESRYRNPMEPLSWRAGFPREVIRLMMVKGPLR